MPGSSMRRHSSQPTQASTRGALTTVAGIVRSPVAANLSPSRPEREPTTSVSLAIAKLGMLITNSRDDSTKDRVSVLLSITTATLGGSKSSGITQEAAMTFCIVPCALLIRTTGPWLRRRYAFASLTGSIMVAVCLLMNGLSLCGWPSVSRLPIFTRPMCAVLFAKI